MHAPQFRCFGDGDPLYERYHDEEWGFPVRGDVALYERITPGGVPVGPLVDHDPAQARRLPAPRSAASSRRGGRGVRRGRGRAAAGRRRIVRNRAKIDASDRQRRRAAGPAGAGGGSLTELVWSHAPARARGRSDTLRTCRRRPPSRRRSPARSAGRASASSGRRPPTLAMQACGVVDDHVAGCPVRARVEAARAASGR